MNVTELRPGNYFLDEGNLYQVLDILLNKTAMRKMVAKVKCKNLRTGAITELARNSGYDVEKTSISKKKMAYLYDAGDTLVFMDNDTFDQIEIAKSNDALGDVSYLKEYYSELFEDNRYSLFMFESNCNELDKMIENHRDMFAVIFKDFIDFGGKR